MNQVKVISALLIFITIISCSEKPKQTTPPKVKVIETVSKNIQNHLDFVGQVYGAQDISIRARVTGFLEGVHFKEGFPVKKGQLLYTIDSQPYDAKVAAQRSLLAQAKSAFIKAQNDLNRYEPLAKSNAVSKADLDASKAQYEAAEAQVKAAEANLKLAKIERGYCNVYSPINGIIGKSLVCEGDLVGQGSVVVLNTVSKMDNILVEFFLPENQYLQAAPKLNKLKKEHPKNEKKYLGLVLANDSVYKYKGAVNFIDRGVDSNTGTILVQAGFANPDLLIRPGQYAKVRVPITHKDAIAIPQKCIKELQGQYSVFVVNSENKIETKQITTGEKVGDLWIVKDGLKTGEKVLIEGIQKVKNDMTVNPEVVEFKSQSTTL